MIGGVLIGAGSGRLQGHHGNRVEANATKSRRHDVGPDIAVFSGYRSSVMGRG